MLDVQSLTLVLNGLTLALALGILLILLWHDPQKRTVQFSAAFLILVMIWNIGALVLQAAQFITTDMRVHHLAEGLFDLGFTGAIVALYVLVTYLAGAHSPQFRVMAFASMAIVIGHRLFLIVNPGVSVTALVNSASPDEINRFQSLSIIYYGLYGLLALFIIVRYRRKIRSTFITLGTVIFILGQGLSFLNPEIAIVSISTNVSSLGCLFIGLAILKQEVIVPLTERNTQVESLHKVSLAISSQLSLQTVLNEIAVQAADWLAADGVGIFLREPDSLELVTAFQLPNEMLKRRVMLGSGMVGTVAVTQKSLYVENYGRDWRGEPDLPLAKETFGSAICVPLSYGGAVTGVLMVIAGRQGRLFNKNDVYLLELLSAQAAVAIANSRLFTEQNALTTQVEAARRQLETLLISTENPVIAVDRKFKLIFANPAARGLFSLLERAAERSIFEVLPRQAFPTHLRAAFREVRNHKVYVYELFYENKWYLCHVAGLGSPRSDGWVTVLNDVTQLKELDRVKSEVVRMVSHDLKNPLMGAMLYLDVAKESATPALIEPLNVIEQQLDRMNRIIRGVLDLEKMRSISTGSELCDGGSIVERVVTELKRLAVDRNIALTSNIADESLYFLGDAEQIERVLVNLVENAIKFSVQGGDVYVDVFARNNEVIFSVKDNGIGIPPALQSQVFERFFRGRQKGVEHVSGSGLGLSIVKTIVENHGGRVWLESSENVGTTFFVALNHVDQATSVLESLTQA